MYGNGAGAAAADRDPRVHSAQAPLPERVSNINNETISMLESCKRSLDHLLGKTLGPRPEEALNELPSIPSLMNDAKRANILTHQLTAKLEELHQVIGHDKQ
jgi:hypothetical protein